MNPPRAQRGIALLTAIILVAIATIVAVSVAWQNALHARRAVAVFTIDQSFAYAQLAEAGAATLLRQNRQDNPRVVAPSQEWAKPLGPWEIDNGATFEGVIEDQAGKFNLNSLVTQPNPGGPLVTNDNAVKQFESLLQSLDLNVSIAARVVDWIDSDSQPNALGGAEDSYYLTQDPPYRTPNMALTSISELLAMGLDRPSYDKLKNFVTALPVNARVNLCTAPGEVLDALTLSGQRNFGLDPKQLAQQRAQFSCFPDLAQFTAVLTPSQKQAVQAQISNSSNYFRLRSWITIGTTRFTLYSLIEQDAGGQIRVLLRTFGTE